MQEEQHTTVDGAVEGTPTSNTTPPTPPIPPATDTVPPKQHSVWKVVAAGGALVAIVIVALVAVWMTTPAPTPVTPPTPLEQLDSAVLSGDASLCESIPDEELKTACTNNIILNLAIESGDTSRCVEMDGELITQDYCEQAVLKAQTSDGQISDMQACEQLSNPDLQASCLQRASISVAIADSNPAVCDELLEAGESADTCHDAVKLVLLMETVKTNEGSTTAMVCDEFRDEVVHSDCADVLAPNLESISAFLALSGSSEVLQVEEATAVGEAFQSTCGQLQSLMTQQVVCAPLLTNSL